MNFQLIFKSNCICSCDVRGIQLFFDGGRGGGVFRFFFFFFFLMGLFVLILFTGWEGY